MRSAATPNLTDRLQLAVRAANVGLWDWDLRTNEVFFSREWKSQLGYAEDELTNAFAEWESRVHPDDLPPTLAKVKAFLAQPTADYSAEFRLRHKDGTYRWILAQADILRDESGKPVRMLGSHIDITARRQGETALREAHERLAKTMETSPGIVCSFRQRTDGSTCFPNGAERMEALCGLPAGTLETDASPVFKLSHPDDVGRLWETIAESARTLTPWRQEWRLRHPVRGEIWLEGHSLPVREPCGSILWHGVVIEVTERKQSEAAARAGEERYRALVRAATDAIITSDEQGMIVSWNPAAEQMFGWTEAEAKGKPLLLIIPERFQPAHLAGIRRIRSGGALRVMDKPVQLTGLHRDGREFPIELSPVRWESGAGQFFGGVIRNISERKRTERALLASEERYRDVLDLSHDLIQSLAPDGRVLLVNRAWRETFGYTDEELPSLTIMSLVHPESRAHCADLFQALQSNARPQPVAAAFVSKTGRRVLVEGTATPRLVDGQLVAVHCSFRDVTQRKHAEDQARLQAAALNAAANEVVITDRHGAIQWINPAFTRTTGYTLEEVVGQSPRVLKSGKHDSAFYRELWATILRGEVWHGEMINRKKDGTLFTEEAIITPVKDEHGEITHFVSIKQDITAKKLLEAKFLRAQRLEGLGALAGGVAHDLNNVLAPILMGAELLRSISTDPKANGVLDMIQDNSQRGAGMIRQILAFARGTAGEKIVMQASHLLKDISKMMKETFPPSIRCELRVAPGLQPVLGESTELYQVLLNLCVNARDAMPKGGTITLSAENARLDETYARQSQGARPGQYVLLTVADTGSGIPPEIRDKIFEPFFTTKEPGKGTGLGLATVKDIVTGHGGFIHLYSELGVGTQFKVYLPVAQGEEAAEGTSFLTLPGGHGELVLLVDDEAAVREIVKATLEGYGYRVVAAADGTEAVARFVEHLQAVQILLTDIQMPHMDGMALIRALRNVQPSLRVIAASGLTTHEAALKATGINVQGFIPKPFTASSLLLALDAALHPK